MAKPNFKFQKRQKELDRKKKQDEKALRKLERTDTEMATEALPDGEESASAVPQAESA